MDNWEQLPPDALGGRDLTVALDRWAAEARVDEAARARTRERWLRQQAEEGASFAGVLVDLAERGRAIIMTTDQGDRIRGWVLALGTDVVALRTDQHSDLLVNLGAIAAVRSPAGSRVLASDRQVHLTMTLADAVRTLAEHRPRVRVTTAPGDAVSGELRSVGRDVLKLRLDGADRGHLYVRISAIAQLAVA